MSELDVERGARPIRRQTSGVGDRHIGSRHGGARTCGDEDGTLGCETTRSTAHVQGAVARLAHGCGRAPPTGSRRGRRPRTARGVDGLAQATMRVAVRRRRGLAVPQSIGDRAGGRLGRARTARGLDVMGVPRDVGERRGCGWGERRQASGCVAYSGNLARALQRQRARAAGRWPRAAGSFRIDHPLDPADEVSASTRSSSRRT